MKTHTDGVQPAQGANNCCTAHRFAVSKCPVSVWLRLIAWAMYCCMWQPIDNPVKPLLLWLACLRSLWLTTTLIRASPACSTFPPTGSALGACLVHRLACFSGRTQTPPPLFSKQASLQKLDTSIEGRQSASGAAPNISTGNGNGNGTGAGESAATPVAAAGGGGEGSSSGLASGPVKRATSASQAPSAVAGSGSGSGGESLRPYSSALPAIITRFRRKVGGWVGGYLVGTWG
jgi:hypothetical protein